MPRVSVIVPTYNREQFIAAAIESVLAQTFTDFEVIVVDDGSADNTREVVGSFNNPCVRYIYQDNQGVAAARNTGIKASDSEYIAFLDSDDILLKEALDRGIKVLDKYPEVAFSYGQFYHIDERGRVLGLPEAKSKRSYVREGVQEIKELLIHGNYIRSNTVIARRSCLHKVGLFDPAFCPGSEDFDLWVRLAKKYAVAYISEPLAGVRIHPNQFGHIRAPDEVEKKNSLILTSIFNDTELAPFFSHLKPYAYFCLYCRMARIAHGRGDIKTTRDYLFRALTTNPMGIFSNQGLGWMLLLIKTWMPPCVLILARRAKRYSTLVSLHRVIPDSLRFMRMLKKQQ